jgi:hypothetical protein
VKRLFFSLVTALILYSEFSQAGLMELSGSFSFSQSTYGSGNFQWTRRWGASLGYYFFSVSELEFAVQDVLYRTKIDGVEDTTFHDQIYSVDWVQSLASKNAWFQPFFKFGIGQLNRQASGTYFGGAAPPAIYDSLTAVLGAGLRIFVFKIFAIRVDGTTYLTGGLLSSWRDNFAINAGASIYF